MSPFVKSSARWIVVFALVVAGVAAVPPAGACGGPCAAADYDGDGVNDWADNCPVTGNPSQRDSDKDTPAPILEVASPPGAPNTPVLSFDGGIRIYPETPYQTAQPLPTDVPPDKGGDACDEDDDNDGSADRARPGAPPDNCPLVPNPGQQDADGDGTGDACDETPSGAAASAGSPPSPALAAAQAPARIRATAPRRLRFADARLGVIVPVDCTARCQVGGQLVLDRRSARRGTVKRPLVLGTGSAFLEGAGRTYLFVEVPARSLRRLARAFRRLRPLVVVTSGGGVVLRRRLTLRR
ncbi:MAG TPA: thrombospondin type 3 repeat-containing protein [Solirubrobacteraceae bacterium]|jgi:hypothetical protein